ncbi:hypothetical protein KJ359_000720 [Pestalotiopsis sp. 9143b]|nr:hypothetical protein KJ359_000720 [Pestalotiopsis sp. 9143b]
MNKNWGDRADKDLFFTILSVKNIGIISGSEWTTIGNHMRTLGYGFTNEGCRQHFQGLRRAQHKVESNGFTGEKPRQGDPTLNPITRRPGPGRGRPKRIPPVPIARPQGPGSVPGSAPGPIPGPVPSAAPGLAPGSAPGHAPGPVPVPVQNQDHDLDAMTAAAVASLANATAALPDPQQHQPPPPPPPQGVPINHQVAHPAPPPPPPAAAAAPVHPAIPPASEAAPHEQLPQTEVSMETPGQDDSPITTQDATPLEMDTGEGDEESEEQPAKRQRLDDPADDLDNSAGMALDDRNVDPMMHDDMPE